MPEIAFRMLISLTLRDPVNIESVMFCDLKNITKGGGGEMLKSPLAATATETATRMGVM